MSSTCARCGLPEAESYGITSEFCMSRVGYEGDVIDCRNRQIAAQAALLRSVTTKLEEAAELLEPPNPSPGEARDLVVSVLEVLS